MTAAKHAVKMFRLFAVFGLAMTMARISPAEVLIVADEFPAMEFLAGKLKAEEKVSATIVSQAELPASLAPFDAVIVYIHGALAEKAEDSFIEYTRAGASWFCCIIRSAQANGRMRIGFPFWEWPCRKGT